MLGIRSAMRVLPAKAAAGLVVGLALFLLVAPGADAAAYYVGGGKGVTLAVRVVDRQIVWSKVGVLEHCLASDRGYYHYTESSEGLAGQVTVGRRGRFGWHSRAKTVGENGDESANGESVTGHVDPTRLVGRFLSYGWFTSSEPPGTHSHGYCRGGSGPQPPVRPVPVAITAHRRPEPPGLAFYFAAKKRGVTAYFEVKGRRIVRSEVGAVHYCTSRDGRRFREDLLAPFYDSIRIGSSGNFRLEETQEEVRPHELLQGTVEPGGIVGSYGYASSGEGSPRCRTGWFEPGHGRSWAVRFVAPRR